MSPSPSGPVARGVALFNEGAFFEAHEAWEDLWRATSKEPARTLLQGLIQVAAAFHKLYVQRDALSAARILTRARAKLASVLRATPSSTSPLGLEHLDVFVAALEEAQASLAASGTWPSAPKLALTAPTTAE